MLADRLRDGFFVVSAFIVRRYQVFVRGIFENNFIERSVQTFLCLFNFAVDVNPGTRQVIDFLSNLSFFGF